MVIIPLNFSPCTLPRIEIVKLKVAFKVLTDNAQPRAAFFIFYYYSILVIMRAGGVTLTFFDGGVPFFGFQ